MMRSLYAGVSGLKNHQIRMDVLGNNISNVNTNGFKKGRVTFQDMISQTLQGAARPTIEKGGVNPRQVGLGMTVASIDTLFSQGSVQTTGNRTDMAIQGDGFFMLSRGENTLYTRAGNFSVDSSRTLVNPANGFRVQGWAAQQMNDGTMVLETSATPTDIRIPIGEKFPARATDDVRMQCNLNSQVPSVENQEEVTEQEIMAGAMHTATIDFYDSQGNTHQLTMEFVKVDDNTWNLVGSVTPESLTEGTSVRLDVGTVGNSISDTVALTFNNRGSLVAVGEVDPNNPNRDIIAGDNQALSVTAVMNINDGTAVGQLQEINISLGTAGLYDGVTQMASPSTTKAVEQNGYGMGYLQDFMIDSDGVITGIYSNGQNKAIGQIAMATFVNPGGLTKVGDNNYTISNNSGIAMIGTPNTQNRGSLIPGALEMSNVDLSEEFTDMIVTQRGFQANSRVITTSDQMLQELLTLKR